MRRYLRRMSALLICEQDETFVTTFDIADAALSRNDSDLTITLPDGVKIFLRGFFDKNAELYDRKNFYPAADIAKSIEAQQNSIPAMGPQPKPLNPTRFHNWDDMDLEKGIDHLDGLDYRSNREFQHETAEHHEGYILDNTISSASQPDIFTPAVSPDVPEKPVTPAAPIIPEVKPEIPVNTDPFPAPEIPEPVIPDPEPEKPEPAPILPDAEPEKPEPENPEPTPEIPEPEKPEPEPVLPDPKPEIPNLEKPEPINPEPVTPQTPPVLTLPNIPVEENGISEGKSVPVTIPDGYEILEVITQGEKGVLEKDSDGNWNYTLKEPATHTEPGKDTKPDGDSVVLKMRDPEGNILEVKQSFDIIDDGPQVSSDHKVIMGGDPVGVTGSVMIDFGADNGDGKSFTVKNQPILCNMAFMGKYGNLNINPDGMYSYIAHPLGVDMDSAVETFHLAVTDADGDTATGTIVIDILKPEPPVLETLLVDEKGIESGESVSINIPEGFTFVGISNEPALGELSGLEYTLTNPASHAKQGEDILSGGDSATLILRDKWGNEYKVEQKINIIDDLPATGSDEQTTEAGDPAGVSGSIPVDFGADNGPGRSLTVNGAKVSADTEVKGEFGTLIISEDGRYSYIADPLDAEHDSAVDKFAVQVKDADGDIATGAITINITKPNGPELSAITVEESGIESRTSVPFIIPDGYTLAGIESSTEKGEVKDDSYILTKPATHGEDDVLTGGDKLILILKDAAGNEYAVEQKVNIVDDVPEIGDDSQSVLSGQSVSGSVLVDFGADNGEGKSLSVEGREIIGELKITGQHGELTIKADGSYTYKANALSTDLSSPLVETFNLQIKDADGDTNTGLITIDITKPNAPALENILVREEGIENGEKTPIKLPDGYTLVRVETDPEKGAITDGKYELKTPAEHTGEGKDTKEDGDSAILVIKDKDGNEFRVEQKFDILDDVPEVGDDVKSVLSGQSVSGSVLVDFGADNGVAKSLSINGDEIVGEKTIATDHGVLTIKSDGNYTFAANPFTADKSSDSVKFDLQIRDADGDIDTGTITINISKPNGPSLENLLVREEEIGDGVSVQIKIPDGFTFVRVETDPEKGVITDGKYELKTPVTHSGDGKDTLPNGDSAVLVLKDNAGNEYRVTQKFDIKDDVPEVGDDAKSVLSGQSVSGSVLADFGADNGVGKSLFINGEEISGEKTVTVAQGVLTIKSDGTYTFTANALDADTSSALAKFNLLIKDADGDTDTGAITINISKPNGPNLSDLVVSESGIAQGESVNITLPEGYMLKELATDPAHGELNDLTYTLKDSLLHKGENSESMPKGDSVELIITDNVGNEFRVTQNFTVIDDTPTATDDSEKISSAATSPISGNVLSNDSVGADGISERGVIWGNESARYGKITLNADGTWSYEIDPDNSEVSGLKNGQTLTETFTYSFTDKDGDEAHATLTITIDGNFIPQRPVYLDIEDEHLLVSEHDMLHGGSLAPITIIDKNGKEYAVAEVLEDGFFGHVEKNGDTWGYVLDKRTRHNGEGADTKENADLVRLRVVDEEGNSFVVVRKVDIIDDLPEMELSRNDLGVVLSGAESESGVLTFDFGADNTDGKKIVVSV